MPNAVTDTPKDAAALRTQLGRHSAFLEKMASSYNWWLTPKDAVKYPERVVAQVMNIGFFRDEMLLLEVLGEDCLRAVLRNAEAGQFNERSWHYWHYRLGLAEPGQMPPMPVRHFS